jgi:diadenosine tetraphosphate (Ap4A) HIT family hydrolase
LLPNQYFRGSALFVAKRCVPELHEMAVPERAAFLFEMSEVARAMWLAFRPRKLNYEMLGNSCPHLHWWLLARRDDDRHPRGPVWEDLNFLRTLWTGQARLEPAERDDARAALLSRLRGVDVEIEAAYV